jgi:hypothetical protein
MPHSMLPASFSTPHHQSHCMGFSPVAMGSCLGEDPAPDPAPGAPPEVCLPLHTLFTTLFAGQQWPLHPDSCSVGGSLF